MLIVIDNIEESVEDEFLKLVEHTKCRFLITSRWDGFHVLKKIPVEELSLEESLSLFNYYYTGRKNNLIASEIIQLVKIKEIHRSNEKIILETEDADRTSLAACVLALRLFGPSKRDETVEQLRIMIKDNFYEDAHRLLNTHLSPDSYSVGTEYYDKVSLIETGDTADVKYHSEYLAKGAGLPRAYAVLYNYCKKKSFIEAWCIENAAVVEGPVDVNELVELYMLGYIKQKR